VNPGVVTLDRTAAAAFGLEPRDATHAPVGAIFVMADGTTVRVTRDGGLAPWPPVRALEGAEGPVRRRAA
jgi:hypothetical protein